MKYNAKPDAGRIMNKLKRRREEKTVSEKGKMKNIQPKIVTLE